MGRHKTNPCRKYFQLNPMNYTNTCKICQTTLIGDHAANLERHLKRHHKEEYNNVQVTKVARKGLNEKDADIRSRSPQNPMKRCLAKPGFISVKLDKKTVISACVELVTVNCCSFDTIECSGFRKILNPVLAAISDSLTINAEIVRSMIPKVSSKIVEEMKVKIGKRPICLKVDVASELGRAVVAINGQFVSEGKVSLFTLAIKELTERHTDVHLRNVVREVLEKYSVTLRQVHSLTTDSGSNIVRRVKLQGEDVGHDIVGHDIIDEDGLLDINLSEDTIGDIAPTELAGVRSVAHSLDQVIQDTFNRIQQGEVIAECLNLARKLSTPSIVIKLTRNGLMKPVFDGRSARWNDTCDMLESLLPCKEFCHLQANTRFGCLMSDENWERLETILETMKPLKEVTLKLQREQMTLSDFYAQWVEIKVKLGNMSNWFSTVLLYFLKVREEKLVEDEYLLGAVFLDPRFQILLSTPQKEKAKRHLKEVWSLITTLKSEESEPGNQGVIGATGIDKEESRESDDDEFERVLRRKEEDSKLENHDLGVDIESILSGFDGVPRIARKKSILEFWEENRTNYPVLYHLASVAFAVPATQFSMERAFSGLKFILQGNRDNLDESTLEDIQIIRSNFECLG